MEPATPSGSSNNDCCSANDHRAARVAPWSGGARVCRHDDPETQSIAPWSLAQIGHKSAIPPLIAALDNDDPSHRVLVIYALETLHAKEAIPRLLMLVNDDRKSGFGLQVTVSEAAKAAIAKLQ